jgi:hypothetical protein
MDRSLHRVACLLGTALLLFSACSDSDDASTTTDASISSEASTPASVGTTSPPTATSTATATSSPASTLAIDGIEPCGLLTTAEVEEATGLAVLDVREELPISCVYDMGPDAGVAIFVSIDDGQGRATAPTSVFESYTALIENGEAEAIADLGSDSVYAPSYRGLAIDAGDAVFIVVGVNGGYIQLAEPRDALIDLARAAVDQL